MAKRKTTQTPKTDWQEVTVRQRTLLADTSTAVFDLEMSLTGLNDAFPHIDEDTLSSMINISPPNTLAISVSFIILQR